MSWLEWSNSDGGRYIGADPDISCTDPTTGSRLLGPRTLGLPRSSNSISEVVNVVSPGVTALLFPSAAFDPPLLRWNDPDEGIGGNFIGEERW